MLKEQEDRIAIGGFGSGLPMQTNIDDCAAAGDSLPALFPFPTSYPVSLATQATLV